jgi:DNA-binding transcriptional MerR regulator
MTQQPISHSTRVSSLALAVTLLAVLGVLAARADAQGPLPPPPAGVPVPGAAATNDTIAPPTRTPSERPTPVRDQMKENRMERTELYQENKGERMDQRMEHQDEVKAMRDAGATPEEVRPVMMENRQERRAMYEDQASERKALRLENRAELKGAVEDRRAQLKERMDQRMEQFGERKAALADRAQARLGTFVDRVVMRMSAAIDRLTQIAGRIDSRIDKIEEKDVDLTNARAALDEAYTQIDVARTDVASLSAIAADVLASDNPRELSDEIRSAATSRWRRG